MEGVFSLDVLQQLPRLPQQRLDLLPLFNSLSRKPAMSFGRDRLVSPRRLRVMILGAKRPSHLPIFASPCIPGREIFQQTAKAALSRYDAETASP